MFEEMRASCNYKSFYASFSSGLSQFLARDFLKAIAFSIFSPNFFAAMTPSEF
jgi:hypothetical protein